MQTPLWQDAITEARVRQLFLAKGVQSVQIKYLSKNHNSKNQMYVAGDLSEVAGMPMGELTANAGTSQKKPLAAA